MDQLFMRGSLVDTRLAGPLSDFFVVGQGALAILEIVRREQEGGLAKQYLVSIYEGRRLDDPAVVDENAVPTVNILGVVTATRLVKSDTEMLARDEVVQQLQG
jgi:hypothetical protein